LSTKPEDWYREVGLYEVISALGIDSGRMTALLANRDARTKVKFLRIRIWKVRAQIGPVMPKITGQTV